MDLRTYRTRKRLTLEDLAASVGVSIATLSRWERALLTPGIATIERIEAATGGAVRARDFLPSRRVTAPTGVYAARKPKGQEGGQKRILVATGGAS